MRVYAANSTGRCYGHRFCPNSCRGFGPKSQKSWPRDLVLVVPGLRHKVIKCHSHFWAAVTPRHVQSHTLTMHSVRRCACILDECSSIWLAFGVRRKLRRIQRKCVARHPESMVPWNRASRRAWHFPKLRNAAGDAENRAWGLSADNSATRDTIVICNCVICPDSPSS